MTFNLQAGVRIFSVFVGLSLSNCVTLSPPRISSFKGVQFILKCSVFMFKLWTVQYIHSSLAFIISSILIIVNELYY